MTILITGVSRGVGAETARVMTQTSPVLGVYRSSTERAEALQAELGAERLRLLKADLESDEGIAQVAYEANSLSGVVFNAGVVRNGSFTEVKDDPLRLQLHADLQAPLLLCRALLAANSLRPGASLVFVTSNLARHGLPGKVAYSAAKAGLEGAVRGLAKELGPVGIRVNAVAPGLLATDMTADLGEDGYAAYADEVPLGRVGGPTDVAPVIAFLLGEAAGYVSGQVIDIDGGWGC